MVLRKLRAGGRVRQNDPPPTSCTPLKGGYKNVVGYNNNIKNIGYEGRLSQRRWAGHTLLPLTASLGAMGEHPVSSLQARWKGESPARGVTRRNPFTPIRRLPEEPLGRSGGFKVRHGRLYIFHIKASPRGQGYRLNGILKNGCRATKRE